MRFFLLGAPQARLDGGPADIGPARQQCVLAALLLDAGDSVPVDRLVDRVWGDQRPARATGALNSYLTRLRRALAGIAIVRRADGYAIDVDRDDVDVHRFERLVEQARRDRDHTLFEQALALWRGEPLAGLDSPWAVSVRRLLDAKRLAAELDHTDLRLELGRHADLVPELLARADAYPSDERAAGQLMLALYRAGRQAEALAHYQSVLSADTGPELRELHQRILTGDASLATPAVRRTPVTVPRQLPAPPAWFTGRDAELTALTEAFAGHRTPLVSIMGNGGIGKTTLALRWAHQHIGEFPDGQLHVNLRGFDPTGAPMTPSAAVRLLLDGLGVPARDVPADLDGQTALYRGLVAGRRMLIMLDNAVDSAQITPLLPDSPTCAVIVTSRDPLTGLVAEHGARPVRLDILDERAASALLTARLGEERMTVDPATVTELLDCCGGYPLALSIAAGRAQTRPGLALSELTAELRDATTRLGVLDEDDPAFGVTAVLSCTYRALTVEQARLFALLGLAPGPDIGLPAAATLIGAGLAQTRQGLTALEQFSLVYQDVPGRWRMHDLVRLYAVDRAQNGDEALCRLVEDYYLASAKNCSDLVDSDSPPRPATRPASDRHPFVPTDGREAIGWFEDELPGLMATQRLALERGWYLRAWRIGWETAAYFYLRGRHLDNLTVWETALAAARHLDNVRLVQALRLTGRAYSRVQRLAEALDHLHQALALAEQDDDLPARHFTHYAIALVHKRSFDFEPALHHAEETLRLARLMDDPHWIAEALSQVGVFAAQLGQHERGLEQCAAALAMFLEQGNVDGQADALDSLGIIATRTGRYAEAVDYHSRSLAVYDQLGNTSVIGAVFEGLGNAHLGLGQHAEARQAWLKAVSVFESHQRDSDADRVRAKLAEHNTVSS